MTSRATRSTTQAVLDRLAEIGCPVGDGEAPGDGEGWQGAPGQSEYVPYILLYRIAVDRESAESSIADLGDAPVLTYQVTAVGADQVQAEMVSDAAAAALLDTALEITDRSIVSVRHESSGGSTPDDDTHPPLWSAIERYRVETGDPDGS